MTSNNTLLTIEAGYIDGKFIGYRLTTPLSDYDGVVFADGSVLPGFRYADKGKAITPGIGKTVHYETVYVGNRNGENVHRPLEQDEHEEDMRNEYNSSRM